MLAQDCPDDLVRATTNPAQGMTSLLLLSQTDPLPSQPPKPRDLPQTLQDLPASTHWATEAIEFEDDGITVANAIENGTAVAVSDGSLKHCIGTAAYVMEGEGHYGRITGVNKVPGPIKEGDSYRCELSGLLSVACVTEALVKRHNIKEGRITVGCDNITSLKVYEPDYDPDPNHESFDLILQAIWTTIRAMPIVWHAIHVKGHKDDHDDVSNLSRMGQLNVEMDTMAKAY